MNSKKILCLGFLMLLIGSLFFVSASSEEVEKKGFFSKIASFITGLITWPGQPDTPDVPNGDEDFKEPVEEECTDSDWTNCGDWGACVGDVKNRTCTSNCENTRVETQSCSVRCSVGNWQNTSEYRCENGLRQRKQNRTTNPLNCNNSLQWISSSCASGESCGGQGVCSAIEVSICENFLYSAWGSCNSVGQKRRDLTLSLPEGCREGNPILVEDCLCTESDWENFSLIPSECPSSGKQNKSWRKIGNCTGGIQKVGVEEVSCNYVAKCTDECFLGNISCFEGGYKECKKDTQNECTRWGNLIPCPTSDYICMSGSCVINEDLVEFNDTKISDALNSSSSSFGNGGTGGNLINGTNMSVGNGIVELKEGNNSLIKFFTADGTAKSFSDINVQISRGVIQDRSFILIKNKNLDYPKKEVYLEIKSSSQGVCIKDQDVDDVSQVLSGCVSVNCPGSSGNYSCGVVSTNSNGKIVLVSGLSHSGIVEILAQPVVRSGSSGGGSSSKGGGVVSVVNNSSVSGDDVKELTKNVTNLDTLKENGGSINWSIFLYYIVGFLVLAILILLIFIYIHRKKQSEEANKTIVVDNKNLNHDVNKDHLAFFQSIYNILDDGIKSFKSNDVESSKKIYLYAKNLYEKNGAYNQDLQNKFIELYNLLNSSSQ